MFDPNAAQSVENKDCNKTISHISFQREGARKQEMKVEGVGDKGKDHHIMREETVNF